MKRLLANLSYSVVANLVTMLVSVLVVLIIPKYWGEVAYGYFQLYLFYISYVGFFHLGWIDGIYLRIGGKNYSDLDRGLYSGQFWLLSVVVLVISAGIFWGSAFFLADGSKLFVLRMTCFCLFIYLPVTYINYIFQATNRIKSYAQIVLVEKIVFIILLTCIMFSGNKNFEWLVTADVAGKVISLVLAVIYARDIVFQKIKNWGIIVKEACLNISIGCKLMVANIASMLIIGIVRFSIEQKWGVAVFGKVSLSLSISNLLINFVLAVSIVIFPLLKQVNDQRRIEIYDMIRHLLMPFLFTALVVYYPVQKILGQFLPAYTESLRYLAIMLPVCIFECKMSLLVNTYLKVMRKERQILYVNVFTVGLSILMTMVAVYGIESLELAISTIVVLVAVRVYLAEYYLSKILGISVIKEIISEILLTLVFVIVNWLVGGWGSVLIYGMCLCVYLMFMKQRISDGLLILKKGF